MFLMPPLKQGRPMVMTFTDLKFFFLAIALASASSEQPIWTLHFKALQTLKQPETSKLFMAE
jgi:hypothetical protein